MREVEIRKINPGWFKLGHPPTAGAFKKGHLVLEGTRKKISIANKGRKPWTFGKHLSEETKKKISSANKGRPSFWKGKKLPAEVKEKLRKSHLGRKLSEKTKIKLSLSRVGEPSGMLGKYLSEETKRKMSEIHKKIGAPWLRGRELSDETRKKIGLANLENKNSLGYKHSLGTRVKMSLSKRGDKCHLWKGGRESLKENMRKCFKYRQWRSDVFKRDGFICQLCGAKKIYLEADHFPKRFFSILDEYTITNLEQALNCEKLWDINNGRTLCKKCHNKTKMGNPKLWQQKNIFGTKQSRF